MDRSRTPNERLAAPQAWVAIVKPLETVDFGVCLTTDAALYHLKPRGLAKTRAKRSATSSLSVSVSLTSRVVIVGVAVTMRVAYASLTRGLTSLDTSPTCIDRFVQAGAKRLRPARHRCLILTCMPKR